MATLTAQPRQDRVGLGIAMMLSAWFLFSLVDSSVKWLVLLGLSAVQLAFMRYAVHFLCSIAMVFRHDGDLGLATHGQARLILFRAALLISATFLNFVALQYLPLTTTSAIMFSSPIIVSALSGPLLGERVGVWRWSAILLGFAGVLVVVRPFGNAFHWASVLIVYNAFAMALFSIITRKLSGTIPAQTMQLYMGALGTAVLLPLAMVNWTNPDTLRDWLLLFGVGAFAWAGHEAFARAHSLADASVLMPFAYSFILFMSALGYLVFGDIPDAFTILGACIIVLSGLIIWLRETRGGPRDDPR